jgi:hypothetical protein
LWKIVPQRETPRHNPNVRRNVYVPAAYATSFVSASACMQKFSAIRIMPWPIPATRKIWTQPNALKSLVNKTFNVEERVTRHHPDHMAHLNLPVLEIKMLTTILAGSSVQALGSMPTPAMVAEKSLTDSKKSGIPYKPEYNYTGQNI